MRQCPRCTRSGLSLAEFPMERRSCLYCKAVNARSYSNRDKDQDVCRRYDISVADYRTMIAAQGGLCAICREPETKVMRGRVARLSLDHDHVTGWVRQLLCHRCNLLVGAIEYAKPDSVGLVIDYLELHDRTFAEDSFCERPV